MRLGSVSLIKNASIWSLYSRMKGLRCCMYRSLDPSNSMPLARFWTSLAKSIKPLWLEGLMASRWMRLCLSGDTIEGQKKRRNKKFPTAGRPISGMWESVSVKKKLSRRRHEGGKRLTELKRLERNSLAMEVSRLMLAAGSTPSGHFSGSISRECGTETTRRMTSETKPGLINSWMPSSEKRCSEDTRVASEVERNRVEGECLFWVISMEMVLRSSSARDLSAVKSWCRPWERKSSVSMVPPSRNERQESSLVRSVRRSRKRVSSKGRSWASSTTRQRISSLISLRRRSVGDRTFSGHAEDLGRTGVVSLAPMVRLASGPVELRSLALSLRWFSPSWEELEWGCWAGGWQSDVSRSNQSAGSAWSSAAKIWLSPATKSSKVCSMAPIFLTSTTGRTRVRESKGSRPLGSWSCADS